jgi:hypothetical protein
MNVDLSRTRGPVIVLIATAIALGCYGLVVNAALGRHNLWLLERDNTNNIPPWIDMGAGRILGVSRERETGLGQAGGRLGILVGASTLQHGIDPSSLTAELGGRYRWSNVLTTGHPTEFNLIVRLMYSHGLNPDVLVLVMNPSVMLPVANIREERIWYDPGRLQDHIRRAEASYVKQDLVAITLVPWNLAFPYRGRVFTLASRSLFAAKVRMLESLGMGLEALYPPDPNPWSESTPRGYPSVLTEEAKREFLKGEENKGWFDPVRYRFDGPNFSLLVSLLRLAHAHGTKSFVVLVPESKRLRDALPPDAGERLTDTIREMLGSDAPIVLDFRDIAPEDEFEDPAHVNAAGITRFTRTLAEALKPYLENRDSAPESHKVL